jgi:hypothetical protein
LVDKLEPRRKAEKLKISVEDEGGEVCGRTGQVLALCKQKTLVWDATELVN